MPTTASDDSIRIRVNKELKKEASELLSSMGLNFSDFFRISLLKLVNEKKMPFLLMFRTKRLLEPCKLPMKGK